MSSKFDQQVGRKFNFLVLIFDRRADMCETNVGRVNILQNLLLCESKGSCQELLARKLHISPITITLALLHWRNLPNWPGIQMLFVPFWGFTCQQHFNLFLRCNREENVFLLHGSMWRGNKSKFSLKFPSSTFRTNFSYAKEVPSRGIRGG